MERLSDLTRFRQEQGARLDFLHAVRTLALAHLASKDARQVALDHGYRRIADLIAKTAVDASDTTTSGGGSELADFYTLTSEWIRAFSARTLVGQLNYVRVPFQTRTILATEVAAAAFVQQGGAIPVVAGSTSDTDTLDRTKLACIAVVTDELVKLWRPGASQQLENILAASLERGTDNAFLSETAAVSGERPAGVLASVDPLGLMTNSAASATSAVATILQAQVDAGSDLDRVLIVTHPSTALSMSLMKNADGGSAFPALGATGGTIVGIPVATSVSCSRSGSPSEKIIAAIDGGKICVADDSVAAISTSRVADLQMDSAPSGSSTNPATSTSVVSMFMASSVAIKLTRTINWQRASTDAVSWMTSTF